MIIFLFIHFSTKTEEIFNTKADFIVGTDGAYSLIRRLMSKKPRFNFNQTYIDHGYVEISYPAAKDESVNNYNIVYII